MLPEKLAVCQLPTGSDLPDWALASGFFSVVRTADELSVVCEESRVPKVVRAERGWIALKLEGPFPFAMTGVLSSFLQPLGDAGISIFAVSTFDTDYVLIKSDTIAASIAALDAVGHRRTE